MLPRKIFKFYSRRDMFSCILKLQTMTFNNQYPPTLCRQILDKMFISSRHKFMPSRPLLISPIHRVNSSSWQVISLSRRVISSCRLYYLQVHYSYILQWFFNSSCRTSTRRVALQLAVSHFNSPFSISVVWTSGLSLQVKPSGPRDEK